jgi:hypothetical protein
MAVVWCLVSNLALFLHVRSDVLARPAGEMANSEFGCQEPNVLQLKLMNDLK